MGQKPVIAERTLEYIAAMVAQTPQEYAARVRQAYFMLRELMAQRNDPSRL